MRSARRSWQWSLRSFSDEAPKINAALRQAERNTALQTTIEDASAIASGLQRGRARLGG